MIYFYLFIEFFKIGLFTFGGGYAMIPLIKDTVLSYSWMSEETFYDFIGVCEATPGPIGVNVATFVGNTMGGIIGGIIATIGVVLPSFIIILLILTIMKKLTSNPYFKGFLRGVTPIIISLILFTGILLFFQNMGYESINSFSFNYKPALIFMILILFSLFSKYILKKKCSPFIIILSSAVLGIIFGII